jgi:hypothetical protein
MHADLVHKVFIPRETEMRGSECGEANGLDGGEELALVEDANHVAGEEAAQGIARYGEFRDSRAGLVKGVDVI